MHVSSLVNRRFAAVIVVALLTACTRDLPTSADDLSVQNAKGGAGGTTSGGSGPVVSAASPNVSKRDTTINVRIFGSGFDRNMTAKWGKAGVVTSDVIVNSTRYVSSTELVANITVTANAELTKYDIIVTSTKTGKPGIGTESFEVVLELPLTSLGGSVNGAYAINDAGQVAGWSSFRTSPTSSGPDQPVMWENGVIRNLMPATGYTIGRSYNINSNGTVVGWVARSAGGIFPFVWSAGSGFKELPVPPGMMNSGATAINDAGVIAGYIDESAVIWVNGVMQVIYSVPSQFVEAWGINSQGEVIGYYHPTMTGGPYTAFIWRPGTGVELLPTLNGSLGMVWDINDAGQIVGAGPLPGDATNHAFIIEDGAARRITTSAPGWSTALSISEYGDVVGVDSQGRGLLWGANDMETLLCKPTFYRDGSRSSCTIYGINSDGTAVGLKSEPNTASNAFRWTQLMALPQ
jgi:uncharacterized membrane protein